MFVRKVWLSLVSVLAVVSCSAITSPYSSSSGGKYDGTYDFSEVQNNPTGTNVFVAARYVKITNSVLLSSDGRLSGSVTDNFGTVSFTGPCPVNGGSARFTGLLDAGNPKGGLGKWVCTIGGATNSWRLYNGA